MQWSLVQARLEDRFRTVAVNLCGYGRSPSGGVEEDIAAVAELLDGQTLLCGHSYGSFVAMHAARRAKVAALQLFEPVCFDLLRQAQDPEGLEQLARLDANPHFWDPAMAGTESWLRGFTEYWNGEGAWEQMSARRRRGQARMGSKLFAEVVAAWHDTTPLSVWKGLTAPVSVAIGEHTTRAARRVATVLCEGLGQPLEEVAGGGHMFPLTHPDLVVDLLRRAPGG